MIIRHPLDRAVRLLLLAPVCLSLLLTTESAAQTDEPPAGFSGASGESDIVTSRRLRDANVPLTAEVEAKLAEMAQAADAAPRDAVKRGEYGLALTRVGKLREGVAHLRRAAALAPDEPKVQLLLARGLWKADELDASIGAAMRAASSPLVTAHDASEAYLVAGTCAFERGRSDDAEAYFKKGLEREPNNASLHLSYTSLLLNQRRTAEAYQQLDAAARKAKEPRVLRKVAELAGHIGRHEIARVAWNRIVELDPDDADGLKYAAMHEFRFEDYPRTIELIERTLKLRPNDAEAHLVYAQALLRSGRHDDAAREARLAEKLGAGLDATAAIHEIENDRSNKR